MLSNIYLHKYKNQNDFSDYLGDKELSLPRFKLVKEFGKDVKQLQTFVPFIKERDQMNRLVRVHSETKHTNQSNSLGRRHSPDGHWYFNENYVMPEKRTKANIKFNYQVATDYQQRTLPHHHEPVQEIPKTSRTQISRTILRSNVKKRTKVNRSPIPQYDEPKKFQIQLPSQVLQPYINREMEAMKQDLFLKVDMDYHFPSDLSDKLIQQKQHIEQLRKRLKEWGEVKSPEDMQDLKEYAQYILSKNS